MAGKITQLFIDDLLSRVDIVDVVGQRIKLKRSGSNHSACCPFHGEKTPSFTVSQTKQFYHCFGCGVHGTAISFLMEHDGMHFVDAIETLAESVGVEVQRENGGNSGGQPYVDNKPLFQLLERVNQYYITTLKNSPIAIEYLKNRGLSGENAKTFGLGYAPDGYDDLSKQFPSNISDLIKTGMLAKNDSGNTYTRFRDRVMFPIRDRRGRIIGFGGRVIAKKEPKYLNSPETTLFHKGTELYGLFEARRSAQDEGFALVVEGYMDVVALAQHEITNAVATLGTACNQQHCELLFRTVSSIVFCFDGDRAGRDAAWRAVQAALPCLQDGRDAHFLFLPDGEDPDSLVSAQGAEGMVEALKGKVPIIDFMFTHLSSDINIEEIGGKAKLAERIKPLLRTIPEGLYRSLSEQHLEKLVGVSLTGNTKSPTGNYSSSPAKQSSNVRKPPAAQQGLTTMRRTIILIIHFPQLVSQLEPAEYQISENLQGATLLLRLIDLCRQHPEINTAGLLENFRELPEWNILNKLAATPYMPDGSDIDIDTANSHYRTCIDRLNKQGRKEDVSKINPADRKGLLGL